MTPSPLRFASSSSDPVRIARPLRLGLQSTSPLRLASSSSPPAAARAPPPVHARASIWIWRRITGGRVDPEASPRRPRPDSGVTGIPFLNPELPRPVVASADRSVHGFGGSAAASSSPSSTAGLPLHWAWLEASPSPSGPADASLPPAPAHGRWPRLSCEGSYISGLPVLQSDLQW